MLGDSISYDKVKDGKHVGKLSFSCRCVQVRRLQRAIDRFHAVTVRLSGICVSWMGVWEALHFLDLHNFNSEFKPWRTPVESFSQSDAIQIYWDSNSQNFQTTKILQVLVGRLEMLAKRSLQQLCVSIFEMSVKQAINDSFGAGFIFTNNKRLYCKATVCPHDRSCDSYLQVSAPVRWKMKQDLLSCSREQNEK